MFRVQNKLFSIPGKSQDIFEKSAKEVIHGDEEECRVWQAGQDVALPLTWSVNIPSQSMLLSTVAKENKASDSGQGAIQKLGLSQACNASIGRSQREDEGFKLSFSYVVSSKSAWVTQEPRSNQPKSGLY